MMNNQKAIINPYNIFVGSFIPNWLLRRKEVSHGAKLVYARLMQYGAKSGKIFPKRQSIADEVGISIPQLDRYIGELESLNLIFSKQRGLTQSNQYFMLEHDWMGLHDVDQSDDEDSGSSDMSTPDSSDMMTQEQSKMMSQESSDVMSHILKDKLKDNSRERACARDVSHETFHDNSSKKKKGTHLSEDWELPNEWRQWCLDRGMFNEEIDRIELTFKNYWLSTNKNSIKIDWFRTWQNWCIKDYENKGKSLKLTKESYQVPELKKIPGNKLSYPSGVLFTQETTDPILEAWNKGQERLRDILTEATYYSWFSKIQFKGIIKGEALFVAPSKFSADYIVRNFSDDIKTVLDEKLKEFYPTMKVNDIRFVI